MSTGGAGGELPDAGPDADAGPPVDQCLDGQDVAILQEQDAAAIAWTCGKPFFWHSPEADMCVQDQTGLSEACSKCFSGYAQCTIAHCLDECLTTHEAQGCIDCRAAKCDAALAACSGL